MCVLAVEGTPGQRLVEILKPMRAYEIRVVDDSAKVTGVGGATFTLPAGTDKACPEQAAIGRAEMKLADQSRSPPNRAAASRAISSAAAANRGSKGSGIPPHQNSPSSQSGTV